MSTSIEITSRPPAEDAVVSCGCQATSTACACQAEASADPGVNQLALGTQPNRWGHGNQCNKKKGFSRMFDESREKNRKIATFNARAATIIRRPRTLALLNPTSHRKRRYWLAVAAVLVAPALILATSGSAQAGTREAAHQALPAATPVNCPGSTLCTYQNANFNDSGASGTQWNFSYNRVPHLVWFYVGAPVNDQISSLYNNRAWVSYVAKACPVGTDTFAFADQAEVLNMASWSWPDGSGMNDSISALAFGTSTTTQTILHGQC